MGGTKVVLRARLKAAAPPPQCAGACAWTLPGVAERAVLRAVVGGGLWGGDILHLLEELNTNNVRLETAAAIRGLISESE